MATNEVKVRFIVSDDGTLKILDEAGRKLGDIENKAGGTTRAMSSLAGGIGAVVGAATAATGALAAIGISALHEADRVNELRQQLGLTATELTSYSVSAKLGGVGLESFGQSLGYLNKQIASGNPLLKELGLQGRDVSTVLAKMSDLFARLPDGPEKTAVAYQLLGRSGRELIPTLNEGAAAFERNAEMGRRLGVVYGDDVAQAADKLFDSIDTLGLGVKGVALEIGTGLLPYAQQALDLTLSWVLANREFVASGMVEYLKQVAETAQAVAGPIATVAGYVNSLADGMASVLANLYVSQTSDNVQFRGPRNLSPEDQVRLQNIRSNSGLTPESVLTGGALGPELSSGMSYYGGMSVAPLVGSTASGGASTFDLSQIRSLLARNGGSTNPTRSRGRIVGGTADPSIGPQLPAFANIPSADISQQLTRQLEVVGESVTVDLGESLADSIKSAVTALISRDDGFDLKDALIAVGQQWGAQLASGMVESLVSGTPLQFVGGGALGGLFGQSAAVGGRFVPTAAGQAGYTATTGYGLSYVPSNQGTTTVVNEFGERFSGPASQSDATLETAAGVSSGAAGSPWLLYAAIAQIVGTSALSKVGDFYELRTSVLNNTYQSPIGTNLLSQSDIDELAGNQVDFVGIGNILGKLGVGKTGRRIGQAIATGGLSEIARLFTSAPTKERQIAKQVDAGFEEAGLFDLPGLAQVRYPGRPVRGGGVVPDFSAAASALEPEISILFKALYGNEHHAGGRATGAFLNRATALGSTEEQIRRDVATYAAGIGLDFTTGLGKASEVFQLATLEPGARTFYGKSVLEREQGKYFETVEAVVDLLSVDLPKGVDAVALALGAVEQQGYRALVSIDKFNERLQAQVQIYEELGNSLDSALGSGLEALLGGGSTRGAVAGDLQQSALQAAQSIAVEAYKATPAYELLQQSLADLVSRTVGDKRGAVAGVLSGIKDITGFAGGNRSGLDIVNYAFLPDSLRSNATALSAAATEARLSLLSPRRRRGALLGQLGELDARIGTITADNVIDYSEAGLYQQLIGQRGAIGQQIVALGGRRNVQLGAGVLDDTARMAERSASLVERQNTLLEGLNLTMSQLILVLSGNLSWLQAGKLSEAEAAERVMRLSAKQAASLRHRIMR